MSWRPGNFVVLLVASMGCWIERQAEARIEYLKAENRLLRSRLGRRRVLFSDAERRTLATLAKNIGTGVLRALDPLVSPATLLRWRRPHNAGVEGSSPSLTTKINVRCSQYLNNLIEQDHRVIKRRCASMTGFKSFGSAAITLAGIELAHRIQKQQFSLGRGLYRNFGSLKQLWERALA
jgi:transposase-like protein